MISSLGSSVHPLVPQDFPHFQVGKSPKLHVDAVRTRAHFRSDTQSMSAIKTSNIHELLCFVLGKLPIQRPCVQQLEKHSQKSNDLHQILLLCGFSRTSDRSTGKAPTREKTRKNLTLLTVHLPCKAGVTGLGPLNLLNSSKHRQFNLCSIHAKMQRWCSPRFKSQ